MENYWFKSDEFKTRLFHWKCNNCKSLFTNSLATQAKNSIFNTTGCKMGCHLVTKKRSDYLTLDIFRPELATEWDVKRNGVPFNRSWLHGLGEYSWICQKCHCNYYSFPIDRLRGGNCLFCEIVEKKKNVNTFDITHSNLISEWDSDNKIFPNEITKNYSQKVKWHCKNCGHKYFESPKNRSRFNCTCPICRIGSSKLDILTEVAIIENNGIVKDNLYENYPGLENEWNYLKNNLLNLTPKIVKIGSSQEVYWNCLDHEHSYKLSIYNRVLKYRENPKENPCPYCSDKLVFVGFNSFADKYPELIKEWDYELNIDIIDPYSVFSKDSASVYWKCSEHNHSYQMTIKQRVDQYSMNCDFNPCLYCNDKLVLKGFNSFADKYPELIKEWDYELNIDIIDPYSVFSKDSTSVYWKCSEHNHSYQMTIKQRVDQYSVNCDFNPCLYCNDKLVLKGFNSFADKYPELIKEWDYELNIDIIDPYSIFSKVSASVYWKCSEHNHSYQMTIKQRVDQYSVNCDFNPCSYCNDKLVLKGFNSFADKYPELLNEVHQINYFETKTMPENNFPNSLIKIWWICMSDSKHIYSKSFKERVLDEERNQEPCTICKGIRRKKNRFIFK